ncbi:DUF222 domain-containing protein [Kribbella sp. NPDC051587]|uniref:HNH endonuclease signature motif containing protein n=1 Tax=Kribbella sp. NPDC051587 TaxID=3364119 RepID=UPI0037B1EB86
MENLAMAPVWSQSGSELLTALDNLYAAKSLIETYILQATARLDEMGTAQELGARDTVELVSQRYRLDPAVVRKDLKFSGALGKYPAVTEALPDPTDPAHPAVLDPALAKVIVTTLEKAPASVPVDVLEVAEEQMVDVARISNPRELAKFGQEVLARLDTDGAEPAEEEALAKETFRLRQVDGGVRFSGFVAGASGELLLTQIHTGAKPHKTVDGERDPRPLDVRQVDSFKGVLDAAAGNPDHPGVPHITVTIDFNDLKSDLGVVTEAAAANTPTPTTTNDGVDASGSTATPGTTARPSTTGGAGAPGATGTPHTAGARSASGSAGAAGPSSQPDTTGAASATDTVGAADGGGPGTTARPNSTGRPSAAHTASAVGTSDEPDATGGAGMSTEVGAVEMTDATGAPGSLVAAGSMDAIGSLGAVGELVFGGNLSASAVRLLACDAAILPIVLGGDSQPLDVGTEQRFVNKYIRRALNQRDKGCVVCKAPPWMCHAHHLIHWADGGPTSLQNLALLCAVHHRAVHAGQWRVSVTDGVVEVKRPAWADPPPTDPADLAAVVAWVTPAHTDCDTAANAPTSSASADAGGGSANGTAGAGTASVSSDPVHWPPSRLPATSTLANPEKEAAREAFRTRLRSLVPNYRDPWATEVTPGAGP